MGSWTGWVKIMAAPAQADKNKQVDQKSEEPSTVLICLYNLYRQFLEVCTVLQGLVSVFLVISGTFQLLWMSDLSEDDPEVRHLSTCKQICWMIIISASLCSSGQFLVGLFTCVDPTALVLPVESPASSLLLCSISCIVAVVIIIKSFIHSSNSASLSSFVASTFLSSSMLSLSLQG